MLTYDQAVALYGCPRALAIAIGVDPSTVAKWQNKKYLPQQHQLELLLLLAPQAHGDMRTAMVAKILKRHVAAVHYLRTRRKDLLHAVPFHKLAPVPEESED